MCLAVPVRIDEIRGREAVCSAGGMTVTARLDLLDDVAVGDWVLVHAGFAITVVDASEAEETWALIEEAYRSAADQEPPRADKTASSGH